MKICFIGFGNLAQAIAHFLLKNSSYQLYATSPSLVSGQNKDNIFTHFDNLAFAHEVDIIILAVKPNKMAAVLAEISPKLSKDCLLISVAAGLSLPWLAKHCGRPQAIVRAMPNIATAVAKGATPLIANQYVTPKHKQLVEQIFSLAGIITWINNEQEMDALTALSGSGPAYFFLFLEALIDGAQQLGINDKIAKDFALQTAQGAIALVEQSNLEISDLRKKVISPAGTTAAALAIFQQKGFQELIFQAMQAAYQRSLQLEILATPSTI